MGTTTTGSIVASVSSPDQYLTIKVCELSQNVTLMDLNTFFSYCGTVAHSQLIQRNKEEHQPMTQIALVTFMQPYALETALLLNDAIIVDSRIRITPIRNSSTLSSSQYPISDDTMKNHHHKSQIMSLFGQKAERKIMWRSIKIQD